VNEQKLHRTAARKTKYETDREESGRARGGI
jgi:hypothetical protein